MKRLIAAAVLLIFVIAVYISGFLYIQKTCETATDMIKIARTDLTGEGQIQPQDIADIVLFLLINRTNAVIDEIIVHRVNKPPFLV